jgi:hypothetical protein
VWPATCPVRWWGACCLSVNLSSREQVRGVASTLGFPRIIYTFAIEAITGVSLPRTFSLPLSTVELDPDL